MTTKTNIEAVNSGQTEREAFERWITTECNYDPVDMVTQPGGEVYVLAGVQEAWDAWQARAASTATATDGERERLIAAYNAGWDASDACDNAYNNGSSEQLAVPGQSQEPEVFQRWRAEWFTNRNEVVTNLLAEQSPAPASPSGEDAANVAIGEREAWLEDLKRIAHELRTYNPAADEYKGEHIHKVWAREIEALLPAAPNGESK